MTPKEIQDYLFSFSEADYADFIAKLIPNISREKIIGIRVAHIRNLAKILHKKENISSKENFLKNLPHQYHEENLLHAFLLSYEKNEDIFIKKLEEFLPFVDNWSTSDSLKNDIFKKNPEKIFEKILIWIESSEEYTVRLGIFFAMKYALGAHFQKNIFEKIVNIFTEKYYINMMISWFLAEAIVTNENEVLEVLKSQKLSKFVQNKAIQKMRESRKISDKMKDFLKNLKK